MNRVLTPLPGLNAWHLEWENGLILHLGIKRE